jgi:transketolase
VEAFGQALVELASAHPNLVVLDADLSSDCRLRTFEEKYPERFIENGIAEQDMVSMAGGLARQGLLPVVNSFASFLAARANEQIYNNACEKSHIIYAMHYAGLIPAGPGLSHQSVRDISLLGALPDVLILQPCNAKETKAALTYCVERASQTCVLRLNIGPSPRALQLPSDYSFKEGQGTVLHQGQDAVIFAYGPVMLHEALSAAEQLDTLGFGLRVVNLPWLNKIDAAWFAETIGDLSTVCVLEDHASFGGINQTLFTVMNQPDGLDKKMLHVFSVEGLPVWGTPAEALHFHGLNGHTLAARILRAVDSSSSGVLDGDNAFQKWSAHNRTP